MPDNPKDIIREAAEELHPSNSPYVPEPAKKELAARLRTLLGGVWLDRETAEHTFEGLLEASVEADHNASMWEGRSKEPAYREDAEAYRSAAAMIRRQLDEEPRK